LPVVIQSLLLDATSEYAIVIVCVFFSSRQNELELTFGS
jgi:hypothetical protein